VLIRRLASLWPEPLRDGCALGKRVVVCALGLILAAPSAANAQSPHTCSFRWDTNATAFMDSLGRPAYVESPTVVRTKSGTLLYGMPTLVWAGHDQLEPAFHDTADYVRRVSDVINNVGLRFRPPGPIERIRAPHVTRPVSGLLAARTANGTVHLIWVVRPPDDSPGAPTEVWHAVELKSGWTEPERVFTANRINWGSGASTVLADGDDVYVLLSYIDRTDDGILVARLSGGHWSFVRHSAEGLPYYVEGAAIGHDSLLVVYSAGDVHAHGHNGSHLFAARVRAEDTTWRAARIQWSGLGTVISPQLVALPGKPNVLLLAWGVMRRGVAGTDSIFTMRSVDGGATWGRADSLALPHVANLLRAVADTTGSMHFLAVMNPPSGRYSFLSLAYSGDDGWSTIDSLPFGSGGSQPAFALAGPDSIVLTWGRSNPTRTRAGATAEAPIGMYVYLTRRCR